jgi:hypothetical protein
MAYIRTSPESRGSDYNYFGLDEEHIQVFEGLDIEQIVPDLENIVPTLDVQTLYENNNSKFAPCQRKGDKSETEQHVLHQDQSSCNHSLLIQGMF